jgi:purine-binding chemotaxis protein CheW
MKAGSAPLDHRTGSGPRARRIRRRTAADSHRVLEGLDPSPGVNQCLCDHASPPGVAHIPMSLWRRREPAPARGTRASRRPWKKEERVFDEDRGSGAATSVADQDVSQYLTFSLGQEEFGIEILRVQEIKGYSAVTAIPNLPPYIKGVMNLRGTVVPVLDLRAKFGMSDSEYTRFTVIIVVNIGSRVVGLIVDAVSDVMDVAASELVPAPDLGPGVDTSFLTGMAKSQDRLISLLAMERVVGMDVAEIAVA